MPFAEFDAVFERFAPHSRIALALAHATVDSQTHLQPVIQDETDYVKKLTDECATEWNDLLNHPFPKALADGTAVLDGFRHYMIQDATYLEYYYRVRMEAVSKTGSFEDIKDFAAKLSSSLQYVADARDDCTNKLGVPKEVVATEDKSDELKNSINLYESVVKTGDWLDIHIVLLPCILGYDTIATKLLRKPETVRNTLYFPLWIQANSGGSSATKYRTFINKSIASLTEEVRQARWQGWVKNFKTACGTEKAFFGLGVNPAKFPAYKILPDGVYTIRNYRKDNQYLIPVSFNPATKNDIYAFGKWELKSTPYGYTIRNVSEGGHLCVSVGDGTQPPYEVHLSGSCMGHWSINPVAIYDEQNKPLPAYQLLVSGKLEFVLDIGSSVNDAKAALEGLLSNVNDPKVVVAGAGTAVHKAVVANNAQISSQFWLLESA